jgi:hypothetical protein
MLNKQITLCLLIFILLSFSINILAGCGPAYGNTCSYMIPPKCVQFMDNDLDNYIRCKNNPELFSDNKEFIYSDKLEDLYNNESEESYLNYTPICVVFNNIKINEPCIDVVKYSDMDSINSDFVQYLYTYYYPPELPLANIVLNEYELINNYQKQYQMSIIQINSYLNSKLDLRNTIVTILDLVESKFYKLSELNKKLIIKMHKTPKDLRITLGIEERRACEYHTIISLEENPDRTIKTFD